MRGFCITHISYFHTKNISVFEISFEIQPISVFAILLFEILTDRSLIFFIVNKLPKNNYHI